jgi:hypothetical protein
VRNLLVKDTKKNEMYVVCVIEFSHESCSFSDNEIKRYACISEFLKWKRFLI